MGRYARQQLIAGWDQEKLGQATVVIAGSNWLSGHVALLAAAMGFGHIALLGDGRVRAGDCRFLLRHAREGESFVRVWAGALRAINPDVEMAFVHDAPCARGFGRMPKPDVVIAASGDAGCLAHGARFAGGHGAGLVAGACGPQVGCMRSDGHISRDFLAFQKAQADPLVGLMLAALMVEDARRHVLRLGAWDRPAPGVALVSPEALHRRARGRPSGLWPKSPRRVAMVGAGALGTWAGIGLGFAATGPVRLDVYDMDIVEAHNLNRQVLFGQSVGKFKADALADALTQGFPLVEAEGIASRVDEDMAQAVFEADAVVCGPDTFSTRALLNRAARTHRVPLVNGGTSAFGAEVAAYVPGHSACLECTLRVETLADQLIDEEARARCGHVPEASVVTSSALAGALMAHELRAALQQRPARGVLVYDGKTSGRRLGVRSVREACGCG